MAGADQLCVLPLQGVGRRCGGDTTCTDGSILHDPASRCFRCHRYACVLRVPSRVLRLLALTLRCSLVLHAGSVGVVVWWCGGVVVWWLRCCGR